MDTEAPYRTIAAEIRGWILSGRLRQGDRIPSTRQICARWGVAMATATKVIATLRDAGLVDTKPGSGTIVRATRQPSTPRRRELDRDRVVRAAMAIADAEGMSAVSMRRVATDLGVATMSLYRHVGSKEDLTLLMADAAAAEVVLRAQPPAHWRSRLEFSCRLLWTICRRRPWVAEVMSMTRPRAAPHLLFYSEWVLTALRDLGLGMDDMMYVHLNLFSHIRGLALSVQAEARERQDTGLTSDEWMDTQEAAFLGIVSDGRYPTMAHVVTQEFEQDLDVMFEYGLRLLLDGVTAAADRGPAGRARPTGPRG
ncbi:TetR/AcrR family transcriptional regulator C-terminal domain-containing protein [Actinokineospora globicatena]|uniref:TetR/AcrR family transcriptional regulator C-terminal domain-containing protein n=1 Tax=Actinokineospora globicatena TaxID=103729 RepID=UPI0020A4EAC5|nr:TetR/AcrR family transcriptional regulator C-terminal domain-containing protein [Actinokineospora globicatena]MCP2306078.1 transcriptional regulator, TetR family [Actinokineospora globicatena]